MIRRYRGVEPKALAEDRSWRVARAILYAQHRSSTESGYNLPAVREALLRAQGSHCAYCSTMQVERDGTHLEHYRPRSLYWWLSWTWENLWLACNACQRKSNAFEVTPARLPAPTAAEVDAAFALSTEHPMLLDPARDAPDEHLAWEKTDRWAWAGRSDRGMATIEALGLTPSRRPGDTDRWRRHLRTHLEPAVARVGAAVKSGDLDKARLEWQQCFALHVHRGPGDPDPPFRAPSWWYLRASHEREGLAAHGMEMPPFPDEGQGLPADPRPLLDDDLPETLSPEARLHACYIRGDKNAPAEHVRAAIEAVCRCGIWPLDALAALLGRTEGTLRPYITALVAAGRVRVEGAGHTLADDIDGPDAGAEPGGDGHE